jgi:stage II sporulation protein E
MIQLKSHEKTAALASDEITAKGYVARSFAAAAVCFAASFGTMAGFPSYMNVACAVMSGRYSGAALIGVIASYAVQGKLLSSAVQTAAVLVAAAVNLIFPYFSKSADPVRLSLFTAAVTVLLSCVTSVSAADSIYAYMAIIGSLMCACTVYAAAFLSDKIKSGEKLRLNGLTAVYCTMIYIAAIATLSSCQIGIFNIGRILSCAVIPAAAKKKRAAGGAIMGALTSVSVTLCSSSLSQNTMLLAASGLICSAFCDFGRTAVALSFMLSSAAGLATAGLNSDTFNMLTDIVTGSAIFVALPKPFLGKFMSRFMTSSSPADTAGQTASSRLVFAALTVSDIKDKLALVSETASARSENLTLERRVIGETCAVCRLHDECERNGCTKRLEKYCVMSEKERECTAVVGCIHSGELENIVRRCREEQLSDRAEAIKLKEMRIFLREQLGSVSDILNDLACRISRRRSIDPQLSAAAKNYFERQGFRGVRACVYIDENCCHRAEIYLSGGFEGETVPLTAGLCRVLECDFEPPEISAVNRVTKLEFDEIPPFCADFGTFATLGGRDSCSGDTLEMFGFSAGEKYLLLSDGMGSGKRARLDSAMAVNLAERMLKSGLSMTTAQRIINSVMRVKDWEESFATLDFLRLDLFAGRAEFLKSGAAPAYLCRDGGTVKIDCDSYPAGILPDCEPDVSSCKLFDGDILILATDGAPESALMQAAAVYCDNPTADAESIAFSLGSLCTADKDKKSGEKCDDITLAVVKITHNSNL